jgi:SNF2 family DNA or RNA helicase
MAKHGTIGGVGRPSLAVVPTSLLMTWQREAARFTPDLRVLILHGPKRAALFDQITDHDLVVTTYGSLRRDIDQLSAQDFEIAILDEAQAVKNPRAATAKAVRLIKARMRIALTGTPVENNLEELWAIMDWCCPGLLGNRTSFNETWRRPIEKDQNAHVQRRLSTRLRPFMLRRRKDEVATDLPPKTEIVETVSMSPTQTALYDTIRLAMNARVRDVLQSKGLAASRITVLDALLKLRQAACDPALVKLPAARKVTASAKRERLLQMLEALQAEGRKVLIFSQFVEMLNLIEQDIQSRGWSFVKLTGKTRNRAEMVDRFQNGQADIFLVSLKAGGTGLTLTAADTVILYDPWWNPATERQAMDRAHRIGQDKPVFVYRLIAENTVEDRIAAMQAQKADLADAIFSSESGGKFNFSEADVLDLFA